MLSNAAVPLRLITTLFLLLIASHAHGDADAASEAESTTRYTQWAYPVAIAAQPEEAVRKRAEELTKQLQIPVGVLQTDAPVGCCLRLSIAPGPHSRPWYLVIVDIGGATIIATDARQLEKACQLLVNRSRQSDLGVEIPLGVMTDFTVISGTPE